MPPLPPAKRWLVTGVAGFIGSHLLEMLLGLDQEVIGLDNFSTGKPANLEAVKNLVTSAQWNRFQFFEGDITDRLMCARVCAGANYVLHQAALGSVPRSLRDPLRYHHNNVTGFLNILMAAREAKVQRFVFASSSSVYGDHPDLPKIEEQIGHPLSPYAAAKGMSEIYAGVFAKSYGFPSIGLRYFNVFGPRQDPAGAYAAVIPKWISAILAGQTIEINGDGETSRDFCYVENVVQANLLAALAEDPAATDQVYNIAMGERTTLNELLALIRDGLLRRKPGLTPPPVVYRDFRSGDIRHSLADIGKARRLLGYAPSCRLREGLDSTMDWYLGQAS